MKYAIEMGSCATIYIPRKTGSGIEKLMGRGYIDRQQGYLINLLLFFKHKDIRLIKIICQ
jgi:hypothetical protein